MWEKVGSLGFETKSYASIHFGKDKNIILHNPATTYANAKLYLVFRFLSETPVTKNLDLEKFFIFFRALESEVAHSYKFLQNRVRYG